MAVARFTTPAPRFPTHPGVAGVAEAAWLGFAAILRGGLPAVAVSPDAAGGPVPTDPPPDGRARVDLIPRPGTSSIRCRTARGLCHSMPLVLDLVASVASGDPAASIRLGDQLVGVFYPLDATDRVALAVALGTLGVDRWELTAPAWSSEAVAGRVVAVGRIVCDLHYTTPMGR